MTITNFIIVTIITVIATIGLIHCLAYRPITELIILIEHLNYKREEKKDNIKRLEDLEVARYNAVVKLSKAKSDSAIDNCYKKIDDIEHEIKFLKAKLNK